jgi:hypothetical protein
MRRNVLICLLFFLLTAPIWAAGAASAANLALSVSMNLAGGGPDKFSTDKLIGALFGKQKAAELAKLRRQLGSATVSTFFAVSDFAVPDAMSLVQKNNMTLPDDPVPAPDNTKALTAALYRAGSSGGTFSVDAMLDNMLSQPVRDQLVADIDKKFGVHGRASYYAVLTQLGSDLHSATSGAAQKPRP